MEMKTIRLKTKQPFGIIICPGARKYAEYALDGCKKILIVSDETVFRLYGNSIKKTVKNVGAEAFTFILPVGENGKNKHVLDKLLILMTELNMGNNDCVIAFGGGSVAKLVGFASAIFKGGVPYVFMPTTVMGMTYSLSDGKSSVDFLGKKDLLSLESYPRAVFCDTEFLNTLPASNLQEGYAEIIRRIMATDKNALDKLASEELSIEQIIYLAILAGEKLKKSKNARFAKTFASVAEKIMGISAKSGKATAFGIMAAVDTAITLGANSQIEDKVSGILKKYDIKWDLGISTVELWNTILIESESLDNISVILPDNNGKCKTKKLSRETIKETFCGR